MPADVLADARSQREIREELESIEFEHAYDNYNAWGAVLQNDHRPPPILRNAHPF